MATEKGLIHIYYGNGKGKTTAAFGLGFRCAGNGFKVVIAQFFKSRTTGEVTAAERFPEITLLRGHPLKKFTFRMNEEEKAMLRLDCAKLFDDTVAETVRSGAKMLILDEAVDAVANGFLSAETVTAFLESKPEELEVVMTGHSLPPELAELADYISNISAERHPYEKGITARRGIEF